MQRFLRERSRYRKLARQLADYGFETIEAAEDFDRRLHDRLTRYGRDQDKPLIDALAQAMEEPVPRSAGSHLATTLYRADLAVELIDFASRYDGPITMSTVVPGDTHWEPSDLSDFDLRRLRSRLKKRLERSDLAGSMMIGGFDFSLNIQASEVWPAHWQPHLLLMIFGIEPQHATAALKNKFKLRSPTESRRLVQSQAYRDGAQATYLLKSRYSRRVTLDGLGTHPTKRPLGHADQPLIPLLRQLAPYRVDDRILTLGCRYRGGELIPFDTGVACGVGR